MANRSETRILTTHVGSLPRPRDLLGMMKYRLTGEGEAIAEDAYDARVTEAVAECVAAQVAAGLDIVTDGETSKAGFFTYIKERIDGFEARDNVKVPFYEAEVSAFPEYYEEYFAKAMLGGAVAPVARMFCTGPVSYSGEDALAKDIANLRAAVDASGAAGAFMPSTAPSGVGYNDYYATDEEFFEAVGEAMRVEYKAIIDAGFDVQVDDPSLSDIFGDPALDEAQKIRKADIYVDSINHALRDLPEENIRFHTCYGINEGPRIFEPPLGAVIGHILKVNASVYSFEAANPRHEHDYHVFEDVKLPEGKAIMPGIVTHASNIVEHPELIAEWLCRFAGLVGRENVIAGADCGFSSQANYHTEVHPTVIWAKFEAMTEGARIASEKLW
ncbi:MAG: cobalamin-independent methionine synthase II family protein [Rhodospirillaceae bacterium]|jgi:5-methyltetrahydropteroyltriglutamate--homocysteine methyltransferase|nr:cobalamin-independent methionine synthase II family protein [Rhodospirillaceae bacterium]MBT3886214.1 cobalamin-independent methionine synthase II family protein [Rhodospirillaceae bacterium]MBT4118461.1 cobalamin-independent methionine synthase II family protein [Rhodospirillaceae bacterium]MBT4671018.1 cobalamin-independent methionine synthase II family protein [Rhodospirillaceae bacterium]MBT4717977.1 cobalamin-independent methionine synthase II family protein [Rhodospirillaceae bacterium